MQLNGVEEIKEQNVMQQGMKLKKKTNKMKHNDLRQVQGKPRSTEYNTVSINEVMQVGNAQMSCRG